MSGVATLTIAFSGENGKSVRSRTKRMMSWSGNHAKVRLFMTSGVSSSRVALASNLVSWCASPGLCEFRNLEEVLECQ